MLKGALSMKHYVRSYADCIPREMCWLLLGRAGEWPSADNASSSSAIRLAAQIGGVIVRAWAFCSALARICRRAGTCTPDAIDRLVSAAL